MVFDNLDDDDGWIRQKRTPVARPPAAQLLRSASSANDGKMPITVETFTDLRESGYFFHSALTKVHI